MLSKKIQDALNSQVNAEYYSSYLYLSMAAHCQAVNLGGFAAWLRLQAQEEMMHAMKIFDFVLERGGRADLAAIEGPPTEWDSPLTIFEDTVKHEQYITGRINSLVDLAIAESDHATNAFLQWFVNEQVEEEAAAEEVLYKLKLMADAPGGLFMLDQQLGQRTPAGRSSVKEPRKGARRAAPAVSESIPRPRRPPRAFARVATDFLHPLDAPVGVVARGAGKDTAETRRGAP